MHFAQVAEADSQSLGVGVRRHPGSRCTVAVGVLDRSRAVAERRMELADPERIVAVHTVLGRDERWARRRDMQTILSTC